MQVLTVPIGLQAESKLPRPPFAYARFNWHNVHVVLEELLEPFQLIFQLRTPMLRSVPR